MALPLAPIAGLALRYGAVAVASYALTRNVTKAHYDQRGQDALDDVEEGFAVRRDPGQTDATARMVRTVRLGKSGPGFEIDASAFGRIKVKRV
ncbi:MAG: hypothetical protein AAGD04_12365 [Pseudomonadota bacterium]